jgi:hypothetical protein
VPSVAQRLDAARRKLKSIEKEVWALLHVHENNKFLSYSSLLVAQVKNSYAAHAFTALQDSSLFYEIAHVCSLWDKPRTLLSEENSIPAVVRLLDSPEVIATLVSEVGDQRGQFGAEKRKACESSLAFAMKHTELVTDSPRLRRLRNFRDKFIAHRLSKSQTEKRSPIPAMKYGDERWLLHRSLIIYKKLELGVTHNSVDLADNLRIVKHHAQCLWSDTKLNIRG